MYAQPIIELQVSASAFLATQLLGLQSQKLSFPPPMSIGTLQVVVDHVEFGANSLRHSVPKEEFVYYMASLSHVFDRVNGRQVQIAQPITVFLADLADIENHPNQPPANLIPIPMTIVINLEYGVGSDGSDRLQFSVVGTESGPLPPLPLGVDGAVLQQQIQSFAQGLTPVRSVILGLAGTLATILAGPGPNVGMSVDSTLTRLAFRLEMGDGIQLDVDTWQSFYQGNVPDRLGRAGWAMFLSGKVLEIQAQIQTEQGIKERPDSRFQLVSGVGSIYSNGGGTALVTTQLSGNVDAGICTVWTDITASSVLSVGAPNSLTIDTDLSWDTHTSACTVTAAILGGILGVVTDFIGPLGSVIVEPIIGALSGVAVVVYLDNATIPHLPTQDCTKVSDTHFTCTQALRLASTPLGTLSFTALVALDDGISLQGQLKANPVGAPRMAIAIDSPFQWSNNLVAGCGGKKKTVSDFLKNPDAFVSLSASVSITSQGLAPVYLLGVKVIGDNLGVFSHSVTTQGQRTPIKILISIPYPGDAYYQNAYPCHLLISTTGGTRLVSIPPAPVLSPQDIRRLGAQLDKQVGDCNNLLDDWFNQHRMYNPVWSVDPGPDQTVEHSYEVEIAGLADGEAVTLVDAGGLALQIGFSQAGRSPQLSAVVAPVNQGEIGLIRGGPVGRMADSTIEAKIAALGPAAVAAQMRGIRVTEKLIIRTAIIALPGACQRVAAAYWDGAPCAFVVLEDRLLAYDVSNPSLPAARFSWQIPGVRGVIAHGASLLAFGDDGFVSLDSRSTRPKAHSCCSQPPIYDVLLGPGVIYSLTDQGINVFSSRLRHVTTVEVEPSHTMARVGNKLVAGGRRGLAVFRLSDPKRPAATEFYQMTGVQELVVPAVAQGNSLLAAADPGPSKLLDFADEDPKVLAIFPQVPWYVGTVRLNNLLLKLVPERTAIQVSFFGRSVQL